MKEIIWIFGTSASGKETFINALSNDNKLQKRLDLHDKQIAVSEQSLRNLGKLDGSRASVVDEASHLLQSNEIVVIKWQYGDTLSHTPDMLNAKFPAFKHTIVRLNVDRDEQIRRLETKAWWHEQGHEDEFIAKELLLVESSIEELKAKFIIIELKW